MGIFSLSTWGRLMGTLWLSPNSLGKLWQSSSPNTCAPAASGSELRFSTAACGERLTAGLGQGLSPVPSPISGVLFLSPRKKSTPNFNFSIPAFKVTPASLSRGYKRAHTLRAASEPRGFRTGGEKSPYCVDNHLLDLTHAPRRWGSIPLAVRPKPQNKLVKTRPYPTLTHFYTSILTIKPQGCRVPSPPRTERWPTWTRIHLASSWTTSRSSRPAPSPS